MTDAATARIWEARPGINGAWSVGHDLRGIGWCEISGPHTRKEAHMIAAAPDMLAALKGLVTTIYARPDMQRLIGLAEEQQIAKAVYVIAQAEGRS